MSAFWGGGGDYKMNISQLKLKRGCIVMRLISSLCSCLQGKFIWPIGFSDRASGRLFSVKDAIYPEPNLIFSPLTNDGIDLNVIAFPFPTFWWRVVK